MVPPFPHQRGLHDLCHLQVLIHRFLCETQVLVARLQLLGPFRHQRLELLLAVEDLDRHVREDARQAADLVRSADHRLHDFVVYLLSRLHLPRGVGDDPDRMRQQSRAQERGNGGENEQHERDEGGFPRFAAHRERDFVQADGDGQTADQDPAGR